MSDASPPKTAKPSSKALRNSNIRARATRGEPVTTIAAELGLNKDTVYKVLNSEETKRILKNAESELTRGVTKAVERMIKMLDNDDDNAAIKAALPILKNFGLLKDKIEIDHGIKPGVQIIDCSIVGKKIILGEESE